MAIEKRDVTFKSGETFAAGWFFLPEGAGPDRPAPAVAMASGMGATKEVHLDQYALRFAGAGIATLLFDYRSFGESGGEPRQRISTHDQVADYRNALTWLSLQPEVDAQRLGVWGTSFSGAHVIEVGALDSRVKAVVSQVGPIDTPRLMRQYTPELLERQQQRAIQERIRHATEGGEVYVKFVTLPGEPGGLFEIPASDPRRDGPDHRREGYDFLMAAKATVAPNWRNEVTLSSLESIIEQSVGGYIDLISPRPLLMIVAKGDMLVPPGPTYEAFARAGEPKRLLEVEGGHYEIYSGEGGEQSTLAATEWFVEHLLKAKTPATAG
jgi:fermentation-respiration switch protein FrsA (DUF1100 family)